MPSSRHGASRTAPAARCPAASLRWTGSAAWRRCWSCSPTSATRPGRRPTACTGALLARADFGVALFFVLSGLLLYRPWVVADATGGDRPVLAAVLPAARGADPPGVLAGAARRGPAGAARRPHDADVVANATLTQVYGGGHLLADFTQTWSLCTEVLFYLLLPPVAVAVGRLAGPAARLALLGAVVAGNLAWTALAATDALPTLASTWLPAHAGWFAAGMLLAALTDDAARRPVGRPGRWARDFADRPGTVLLLAGALAALAVTPLAGPRTLAPTTPGESVVKELLYGVVALLLVAAALVAAPRTPAARAARRPGRPGGRGGWATASSSGTCWCWTASWRCSTSRCSAATRYRWPSSRWPAACWSRGCHGRTSSGRCSTGSARRCRRAGTGTSRTDEQGQQPRGTTRRPGRLTPPPPGRPPARAPAASGPAAPRAPGRHARPRPRPAGGRAPRRARPRRPAGRASPLARQRGRRRAAAHPPAPTRRAGARASGEPGERDQRAETGEQPAHGASGPARSRGAPWPTRPPGAASPAASRRRSPRVSERPAAVARQPAFAPSSRTSSAAGPGRDGQLPVLRVVPDPGDGPVRDRRRPGAERRPGRAPAPTRRGPRPGLRRAASSTVAAQAVAGSAAPESSCRTLAVTANRTVRPPTRSSGPTSHGDVTAAAGGSTREGDLGQPQLLRPGVAGPDEDEPEGPPGERLDPAARRVPADRHPTLVAAAGHHHRGERLPGGPVGRSAGAR